MSARQERDETATGDGLSKRDYELLAEFRHLLRRFLAFSEESARRHGLTSQQHQALLAVKGFPGARSLTVGELAARLDIRHHSAVGLVDRLEARRLVKRVIDPDDRRQVFVGLTPAADAILARLTAAHRRELRQLAPNLSVLLARLRGASDDPEAPR